MEIVYRNLSDIKPHPDNPRRKKNDDTIKEFAEKIKANPKHFEARPILLSNRTGELVIIGGERRSEAAKFLGWKEAPTILIEGLTKEEEDAILIQDNTHVGVWDEEKLKKWEKSELKGWGVELPEWNGENAEDERARREAEFRARMEAGEISEEDEEYQEFLEKFKLAKTTDDCYTPELVYDAMADWVAKEYGVRRADFVRPFYPGGDYKREKYKKNDIVVDNPPFSILSQILKFYNERGVRFFLFAPTLTLFSSSSSSSSSTAIPCGVAVTYANGANVNTSFLTNMESRAVRLRSAPTLYKVVKAANDRNLRMMKKVLPKYSYDRHIITAPWVAALSRLGIDFSVPVAESEPISRLDMQVESKKGIYGNGYIVSDRVYSEREKAEREKAERWELSDRERAIVERLNKAGSKPGK